MSGRQPPTVAYLACSFNREIFDRGSQPGTTLCFTYIDLPAGPLNKWSKDLQLLSHNMQIK